jgi:hypothetical protein
MNGTKLPYFRIVATSGKRNGEVIENEVWSQKEAIEKATSYGTKLKATIKVEQVKTVFETGEQEKIIPGWND